MRIGLLSGLLILGVSARPALALDCGEASPQRCDVLEGDQEPGAQSEAFDRFGTSVISGDFDGNNRDDIAVGVPFADEGGLGATGKVLIYYAAANGAIDYSNVQTLTLDDIGFTPQAGDQFGRALAVGDFNADGVDDLAVSAPYRDIAGISNTGLVGVIEGRAGVGLVDNPRFLLSSSVFGQLLRAEVRFGLTLTTANLLGGGEDDLVVGAHRESVGGSDLAGRIYIFSGAHMGAPPAQAAAFSLGDLTSQAAEAGDQFGFSLAAGNLDGDSDPDLVIGVPYRDHNGNDSGIVVICYDEVSDAACQWRSQNSIASGESEPGDLFGYALAIGSINDTSTIFQELVVSAPGESFNFPTRWNATNQYFTQIFGKVVMIRGDGGGLDFSKTETLYSADSNPASPATDFGLFGSALVLDDFDGDGLDDLVVSEPFRDLEVWDQSANTTSAAGAIHAFFAFSSGVSLTTGADPRSFTERSRSYYEGISTFHPNRSAQPYDFFASSLSSARISGRARLLIGVPNLDDGSKRQTGAVYATELEPGAPAGLARAAIVVDRNTGEVLGARRPDLLHAPASTTKMMTALVAREAQLAANIPLDQFFTVSAAAANGGSGYTVGSCTLTQQVADTGRDCYDPWVGLLVGDRMRLQSLYASLMLRSGGDAGATMAEGLTGIDRFVERMRSMASVDLGLRNTHFENVTGKDPEDYAPGCSGNDFNGTGCRHFSTARDLAVIARAYLDDPFLEILAGIQEYNILDDWQRLVSRRYVPVFQSESFCTTNSLLRTGTVACDASNSALAIASGIKTGTSHRAGKTLVARARDNGRDVIVVMLGVPEDGPRYSTATSLINFGVSL